MCATRTLRVAARADGLVLSLAIGAFVAVTARGTLSKKEPWNLGDRSAMLRTREAHVSLPDRTSPEDSLQKGHALAIPSEDHGWFVALDAETQLPVATARAFIERRGASTQELLLDEGRFRLDLMPEESQDGLLRVEAMGYFGLAARLVSLSPEGAQLYLIPVERVCMRCLSSEDGEPVPDALIRATAGTLDDFDETEASTDETGEACLEGLLFEFRKPEVNGQPPEYELELTVAAKGFVDKASRVRVVPGKAWGRVELLLDPARSFTLRVVRAGSQDPVERALVVHQWDYLGRSNVNRNYRVINTDERGELVLAVREGARGIQVIASHHDHATRGIEVDDLDMLPAGDGGASEMLLELDVRHAVDGLVIDENGEPVGDVMVDLDPIGRPDFTYWMRFAAHSRFGHIPDMAPTDAEGRFSLDHAAPGEYRVTLHHRDYYTDPENPILVVGPQAQAWIGVVMRGIELRGTVVDERGAPIEDATLVLLLLGEDDKRLEGSSGLGKTVSTDANGCFVARGLIPGRYEARFSAGHSLRGHREIVDAAIAPMPWRVVLRSKLPRNQGGHVWLLVRSPADHGIEGRARVSLYRLTDLSREASYVETIRGSEVHCVGAPMGILHAVLEVDGYAPVVLPFLEVTASPEEPVACVISPGLPATIEVGPAAKSGVLEVREPRFELILSETVLSASSDVAGSRARLRLEPGSYTARFTLEGGGSSGGSFTLSSAMVGVEPSLRIEAPAME